MTVPMRYAEIWRPNERPRTPINKILVPQPQRVRP